MGSALCDALLARGDEVVGLTRDPDRARSTNPTRRWHRWGPAMERPPAEAFDEVDGVINLIGEPIDQRWTDDAKVGSCESRAHRDPQPGRTRSAALERKPRVMVSQSAVGFYGDRGERLVDESASRRGRIRRRGASASGRTAAARSSKLGVRLVITRTGLVLDPGTGLLKQLLMPFKLGLGGPIAGGDQYMSWIHVDDEVGVLLWALDNDAVSGVDQRDRAEPGHQPRALEDARPGAAAAGGDAGAGLRPQRDVRPRVGRDAARRAAGDPAPHPRPRLRLRAPRAGGGAAGPAALAAQRSGT